MIISTVRNATPNGSSGLGFLNDRLRFNVAVSRAKWLVLVVGDPKVLVSGDWASFMQGAHYVFGRVIAVGESESLITELPPKGNCLSLMVIRLVKDKLGSKINHFITS